MNTVNQLSTLFAFIVAMIVQQLAFYVNEKDLKTLG